MKALIALITVLLLTGCVIDGSEAEKAIKHCEKHGGLKYLRADIDKLARCKDNSSIFIDDIKTGIE